MKGAVQVGARAFFWAVFALFPPLMGMRLGERVARGGAWAARHGGHRALPPEIREFPCRVAHLFGQAPTPAEARRLLQERLVFVVTRHLLRRRLNSRPASARQLVPCIDLRGKEHLEAALGRGRGAIVISAHFGYFRLIRVVVEACGAQVVVARRTGMHAGDVALGGDLWARVGALHQIREELTRNRVCVVVADGLAGRPIRVPFFQKEVAVGLGAFYLARLAGCPILPYFVVTPQRPPCFRVEFSPPLPPSTASGPGAFDQAVQKFVALYRAYARRYPSHISHRLLATADPGPTFRV